MQDDCPLLAFWDAERRDLRPGWEACIDWQHDDTRPTLAFGDIWCIDTLYTQRDVDRAGVIALLRPLVRAHLDLYAKVHEIPVPRAYVFGLVLIIVSLAAALLSVALLAIPWCRGFAMALMWCVVPPNIVGNFLVWWFVKERDAYVDALRTVVSEDLHNRDPL